MAFPFIPVLITIGIAASITSFIYDQLTEDEIESRDYIYEEYDRYEKNKEVELKEILFQKDIDIKELQKQYGDDWEELRQKHFQKSQQIRRQLYDTLKDKLNEQRNRRQNLQLEIKEVLNNTRYITGNNQHTFLRREAMELLRHELQEAHAKVYAYIEYLKRYEKTLDFLFNRGEELPPCFNFLLPQDFPYQGQLIYVTKKELVNGFIRIIEPEIKLSFACSDLEEVNDFAESAIIPCMIVKWDNLNYKYIVSCGKGLFKYSALNNPGIGVEAVVYKIEKRRLILNYRGLNLYIPRQELENPVRIPPRGVRIQVFPLKWDYNLYRPAIVTTRYQNSMRLCQFDTIPLVFQEQKFRDFDLYMEKNELWDREDQWKIAPFNEDYIPKMDYIKLQLGTEMIMKCKIVSDTNDSICYLCYEELLTSEHFCKPEDIFIPINATMKIVFEDEIGLYNDMDYRNANSLLLFLINEFKSQKIIKNSHTGIAYYNKWTQVTQALINYKKKGKYLKTIVSSVTETRKDQFNNVRKYEIQVDHPEEVEKFYELNLESSYNRMEFFIEDKNGHYLPIEFTYQDKDKFHVLGEVSLEPGELITIYRKTFPYPEFMQVRALQVFREGYLSNPKLKEFMLQGSNVEPMIDQYIPSHFYDSRVRNNQFQRETVCRASQEKNFFMIQGPPGTGKTTVIKEIIMQHLARYPSHRILVVSQANVAVDNVLRELMQTEYGISADNMVRCGKIAKIDEDIQPIAFETRYDYYCDKLNTLQETEQNRFYLAQWRKIVGSSGSSNNEVNPLVGGLILKGHQVVAATCIGLAQRKIGLDQMSFDLVIIDEAGTALPAELLLPVNRAQKVIIIGDTQQLPPTVDASLYDSEKVDLDDRDYCVDELFSHSLFERLYNDCPDSNKSMLRTQYRMPAVLGDLISRLFYEGKIENGSFTYEKTPIYFSTHLNWLDMSDMHEYREVYDSQFGKSPCNHKEAEIVVDLIQKIRDSVSNDIRIAVITPYKGQKRLILKRLKDQEIYTRDINVTVNTVDAFQGDEAEIVFYCTTRSQTPTKFFSDQARVNVALSRTKNELLIIGSRRYFQKYGVGSTLYQVAEYIADHGKIFNWTKMNSYGYRINSSMNI